MYYLTFPIIHKYTYEPSRTELDPSSKMKSSWLIASSLLSAAVAYAPPPTGNMPAMIDKVEDIDRVFLRLDGIKEKCLVEDLPRQTVVLSKLKLLLGQ